jgi:hypothetical protein
LAGHLGWGGRFPTVAAPLVAIQKALFPHLGELFDGSLFTF